MKANKTQREKGSVGTTQKCYELYWNSKYIYIYILSLKKKPKTGYEFISILFCVSDVNQKHEEKYNRTSSDLMDKIKQNRHGVEGWKRGEELPPSFYYLYELSTRKI